MAEHDYLTLEDFDFNDKTVILRSDINCPIDPKTKKIVNEIRIERSMPTFTALIEKGARLVIIAHQGDTLDYQNLISLAEHAETLSKKLNRDVQFIDDVAGPAARDKIRSLGRGEVLLLDNLRFLTEEVSTFEDAVKLSPQQMTQTYLVRNLAPLADYYVNDAFAAAHRNSPSMVAFQELLPSAAGVLYDIEVGTLNKILSNPQRPSVFMLGGAKVSDSFSMMENVLSTGAADLVLTSGVTGHIMLLAAGQKLGSPSEKFIIDHGLQKFIEHAKRCLDNYSEKIMMPVDFGVDFQGERSEVGIEELPVEWQIIDIGPVTVSKYRDALDRAGTIFVNGPAGVYERPHGSYGTEELWKAVAQSRGFSVIGGGDTIASASKFGAGDAIDYITTGGGAFIRFVAGIEMPLMTAMKKARKRWGPD